MKVTPFPNICNIFRALKVSPTLMVCVCGNKKKQQQTTTYLLISQ